MAGQLSVPYMKPAGVSAAAAEGAAGLAVTALAATGTAAARAAAVMMAPSALDTARIRIPTITSI